jgi:hypothetical protein
MYDIINQRDCSHEQEGEKMRRAWIVLGIAIMCIVPSQAQAMGFGMMLEEGWGNAADYQFNEQFIPDIKFSETEWKSGTWQDSWFDMDSMLEDAFHTLAMERVFTAPPVGDPLKFNVPDFRIKQDPPRCTIHKYNSLIPSPSDRYHDLEICQVGVLTTIEYVIGIPFPKHAYGQCVKAGMFPIDESLCNKYTIDQFNLQYGLSNSTYFCTKNKEITVDLSNELLGLIENLHNDVCKK